MEEQKTEEQTEKKKEERVSVRDVTEAGAAKAKELRFTKRVQMTWIDEDDARHEGEFTIKRPTIGESARIGVLMAEMRQDKPLSSIDRSTASLHERLATCIVCITKAPPWWDPENMFDEEPLLKLYASVVAYFNSFRKTVE